MWCLASRPKKKEQCELEQKEKPPNDKLFCEKHKEKLSRGNSKSEQTEGKKNQRELKTRPFFLIPQRTRKKNDSLYGETKKEG